MSVDFTNKLFRLREKYIAQPNSEYDIIKLEDVSENNLIVGSPKEDEVTIKYENKNESATECLNEDEIKIMKKRIIVMC